MLKPQGNSIISRATHCFSIMAFVKTPPKWLPVTKLSHNNLPIMQSENVPKEQILRSLIPGAGYLRFLNLDSINLKYMPLF